MSQIEQRLGALGISLPKAPDPMGNFLPYLVEGSYLFISGQVSVDMRGSVCQGKLRDINDVPEGRKAAQLCAIGLLARAKSALDNLDRIDRLVKLGAFVNASPDFRDHPSVADGASDFMVDVLGEEKGRHVRFAVGNSSLPFDASVEIEAVFHAHE